MQPPIVYFLDGVAAKRRVFPRIAPCDSGMRAQICSEQGAD